MSSSLVFLGLLLGLFVVVSGRSIREEFGVESIDPALTEEQTLTNEDLLGAYPRQYTWTEPKDTSHSCGHKSQSVNSQKKRATAQTCDYGFNHSLPCEDPEVRSLYAAALSPDRFTADVPRPIVRYNLVVFHDDAGENPTATDEQIQEQHAILLDAFAPARIQFTYKVQRYYQSILRYRTIVQGPCNRENVNNGKIDAGCMSLATGWDGGSVMCTNPSCDPTCSSYDEVVNRPSECPCVCVPEYFNCVPQMIKNRYCNAECNFAQWNWDGGDCCPNNTDSNQSINKDFTCRDPNHILRNWMDPYDLYYFLNLNSGSQLNVVLIPGDTGYHMGDARTPNDPRYFTREGGILINTNRKAFGVWLKEGYTGLTLIHMMGHALGLLHTHAGVTDLLSANVSKADACRDPCQEEQPLLSQQGSDTTGDLISDTRPTPQNTKCSDPLPCSSRGEPVFCTDCHTQQWLSTPYNNYMGFASDSCPKDFTPQQMGRMYCYVDLFLRHKYLASGEASPGPILLPPAVSDSQGSIKVDWSAIFPYELGTNASPSTFTWLLERSPPLPGLVQVVGTTFYLDRAIDARVSYKYRVRLVIRGQLSVWSPWSSAIALPRVCNCRPWDLSAVKEIDAVRTNGACN